MEFVLVCLNVVLQVNLNLRRHLRANVLQEEASNDTETTESDG